MSDYLFLFANPRLRYTGFPGDEQRPAWSRQTALMVYLASQPGWHSRSSIAELFRPEANSKDAAAYVRRLLHRLGTEYPQLTALTEHAGMLRWTGGSDVADFHAALQAGDLESALQLQHAPFLDAMPTTGMAQFDQWIADLRRQLSSDLDHALVQAISRGDPATEEQRARWIRHLGERAMRNEGIAQFLLAQARTPQESATATLAFENLQHHLATQYGQRPTEASLEQYKVVKALTGTGLPLPNHDNDAAPQQQPKASVEETKPVSAGPGHDHTPVRQGLQIGGRESELARLDALLRNPAQRLISIVGMGGMGKTWLARALHQQTRTSSQGAVEWVDLITVRSRSEMLAAIASAVGMASRQGSLESQLLYWLKARNTVLFLDNFEQLLNDRDVLDTLLDGAPGLRFVVTSRRPLLLPSEQLFQLQGLEWSGNAAPAFRLFKHHADRAGSPVEENTRDIEAVLNHLEGMPLAIEVAAAWMPLLSPAEILRQLKQDPAMIDAAAEPQAEGRGIGAVLRTTWAQMGTGEKQAMVAMSSVRGTMDWEAAQALVHPDPTALLRLASALVLRRDGSGRYALHPLFREFVEKNAAPAMLADAHERHARHFMQRISSLPLPAPGAHDADYLRQHGPYIPDFIQAWQHCVEHNNIDSLARAFPGLAELLMLARRFEEAMELCKFTTNVLGVKAPISAPVAALHAASAFRAGRMGEAADVAIAGLQRACNPSTRARLYTCLSSVHWFHGQYEEALMLANLANESLAEPDVVTTVQVREQLALCHYATGELDKAAHYLQANLSMAALHGAEQLEGRTLSLLGVVTTADDRGDDALPLFRRALAIFEDVNDTIEIGYCLRAMSYAYYRTQRFDLQMESARKALEIFERAGYYHETGEALFAVTTALHASGDLHGAKAMCEKALAHCRAVGNIPAAMRCIGALGIFIMQPPGKGLDYAQNEAVNGLVSQRINGLSIVLFAVQHPSFRKRDRLIYERLLQALQVCDAERAVAAKMAMQRSFESLCTELQQAGSHEALAAGHGTYSSR